MALTDTPSDTPPLKRPRVEGEEDVHPRDARIVFEPEGHGGFTPQERQELNGLNPSFFRRGSPWKAGEGWLGGRDLGGFGPEGAVSGGFTPQ